jgi:hypothetical protein
MLIATARSEKHLHVSADRFCRYLRREHGLRANAAGLLGRNELKIKLRRKAKRMKMLANVGGGNPGDPDPMANLDDGIRTGWICCTLGKVAAHPEDTKLPGDDVQGFVGFRESKPGVNVVVQMFTEEKRAETDLETLWGGVVKSHERNEGLAEQLAQEFDEADAKEEKALEEEEREAMRMEEEATRREMEEMAARPRDSRPPREVGPTPTFKKMPRPTTSAEFPPASSPRRLQSVRRIHTVGLRACRNDLDCT